MKKLYCNGKKDFCPYFDGTKLPTCHILNCAFIDNSGTEVVEIPNTNYDRIRNMSIDEMAAFCARNFGCKNCEARELCRKINSGDCILNCFDNVKQWLESEVE